MLENETNYIHQYGLNEVLQLKVVERPIPKDYEVRKKIYEPLLPNRTVSLELASRFASLLC
jgi:hypothetical protein